MCLPHHQLTTGGSKRGGGDTGGLACSRRFRDDRQCREGIMNTMETEERRNENNTSFLNLVTVAEGRPPRSKARSWSPEVGEIRCAVSGLHRH